MVIRLLVLGVLVGGAVLLVRTFDGNDPGYDYVATWDDASVHGDAITLTYTGGSCDDHAFTSVDESDHRVRITVFVVETDDQDCSAAGYTRTIDVQLAEPLGGRRLVDGGPDS